MEIDSVLKNIALQIIRHPETNMRQLSIDTGIHYQTIKGMKSGDICKRPSVDHVEAILQWQAAKERKLMKIMKSLEKYHHDQS